MVFTRIDKKSRAAIPFGWWSEMIGALICAGFEFNVVLERGAVEVRNFRVDPETRGYNRGGYRYYAGFLKNPARTRVLSWSDWVEVHGIINAVLDRHEVRCRIYTLGGKFEVRHHVHGARTESTWEPFKYENVGSQFCPVARVDLYRHESEFSDA